LAAPMRRPLDVQGQWGGPRLGQRGPPQHMPPSRQRRSTASWRRSIDGRGLALPPPGQAWVTIAGNRVETLRSGPPARLGASATTTTRSGLHHACLHAEALPQRPHSFPPALKAFAPTAGGGPSNVASVKLVANRRRTPSTSAKGSRIEVRRPYSPASSGRGGATPTPMARMDPAAA